MSSDEAGNPDIYALLGDVLMAAGLANEAVEAYGAAAERSPQPFAVLHRAVLAMTRAGQTESAFALALKAQKLVDGDPDVIYAVARGLLERGDTETLAYFRNRLTASDNPLHLDLAKQLIGHDNRNPFNLALFRKLAAQQPDDPFLRFKLMSIAREFCDYDTIEAEECWMNNKLEAGDESIFEGETPYANLLHCPDPRLNRLATNNSAIPVPPIAGTAERRRSRPHLWTDRIRIGYLSGDFSSTHATMRLLRNVLESHDRTSFDITLYCHTPQSLIDNDDGGRSSWGRIVPVHDLDDKHAADRIRQDNIDILVDLKGHTGGSRCQILNLGPAPIQVAWLGFPGSTTNVDLDYVIGDHFVLPDAAAPFYHENFVRLPDSYQPNDPVHRPKPGAASREVLGLPENRFVFASFNAQRKITLETTVLWAEILKATGTSVLWVMIDGDIARRNFLNRMGNLGIDAARILFCTMAPYPDHIARLQAADLGLDTFPYNGHTTTSDMLWAGLPLLTRRGSNFASSVSQSLLAAVGLPQLVAADDSALVATAIALAQVPVRLAAITQKLCDNRDIAPLFDSERFTRQLEQAYEIMAGRAQTGQPPAPFDL